jgi:hypothetical protein
MDIMPHKLPEESPPPAPHTAAVLAATFLPVVFVFVFLLVLGGIFFAGLKVYQRINKSGPAPVAAHPQSTVAVTPLAPTPKAPDPAPVGIPNPPVTAPAAPMVVTVPEVDTPLPPPPKLDDFVPPIVPPGKLLVLRGQGLAAVNHVSLISMRGAKTVEAKIVYTRENQAIITIPQVPFENDPIALLISSPGGIVVTIDQRTGATPWGTDGHLHDTAVIVRGEDEITTHDNMVLIAREGSAFSIGDNSTAFAEKNVTVKGHGKNCHIYYVGPIELGPGVSRQGMTEVSWLQVYEEMDAFRVKPALPDGDQ